MCLGMNVILIRFLWVLLFAGALLPSEPAAQDTPSITLYDDENQAVTSSDNTAVFSTLPGRSFRFEIDGAPGSPFSVYLSASRSPFPFDESPPALLVSPPLFPLLVDPELILDDLGGYSTTMTIPHEFSMLDDDLDMYLQGFVQDRNLGLQLTNGITLRLGYARYKARVAMAHVDQQGAMEHMGEIWEGNAKDNLISGSDPKGLSNGSPLEEDKSLQEGMKMLSIDHEMVGRSATSLFLNGIFPLVSGDAGASVDSMTGAGSSLHIHVRDRVCRNGENPYLQHIIIPVKENGQKRNDLNLYHFFDAATGEGGFMVLDVSRNRFYELSGSRHEGRGSRFKSKGQRSPWDPHVAISPDGKLMAAVLSRDDADGVCDELFVFRLLEDDLWTGSGSHARRIDMEEGIQAAGGIRTIFAESLTFAGMPKPHLLFFVTDRPAPRGDGSLTSDLSGLPASLFSVHGSLEGKPAGYHDFISTDRLPRAGDGISPFLLFGDPDPVAGDGSMNGRLNWLRSEDYGTLFLRAGWLLKKGGPSGADAWSWDILALTKLHCTDRGCSFAFENVTRFAPETQISDARISDLQSSAPRNGGMYIPPFGNAYDGTAKAAVSRADNEGRTFIAFTAFSHPEVEHLYLASNRGLDAGALKPVTASDRFAGAFSPSPRGTGAAVFDPCFIRPGVVVFFYGQADGVNGHGARTDLYSYQWSAEKVRNLTCTTAVAEGASDKRANATPPFSRYGDIRPYGCFPSHDGRYLLFLRGYAQGTDGSPRVNLAGVDSLDDCAIIDFTGNEFSHGFAPALGCASMNRESHSSVAERMNLSLAPSGDSLFFTATTAADGTDPVYQVFMLSMKNPVAATPVTSFVKNEVGYVTQIVPDPKGEYVAFTRTAFHESDGREKTYVAELGRNHALLEMTGGAGTRYPAVPLYGSMGFVSNQSITQFIFGLGNAQGISSHGNPEEARLWLYPLNDRACKDPRAYPLTEEGRFMVFNLLSVPE